METTYEKRAPGGKISLTAIALLLTLLTACSSAAVPTRGTAASDAADTGVSSGQPYSSASSCIQSAVRAMAPSRVSSSSAAPVSPAAPAAASSVASSSAKSSQRSSVSPSTVTGKRILIGYYGSWDAYTGFTPDKINVRQINTINYAFVSVGSDYKLRLSDSATDQSNFAKLRRLKAANPGLKVVLAVGGWDDSGEFSAAAATQQARNTFAGSCADFLRSYGLDGINIDWEYPCSGGKTQGSPSDKANFTLLLQAVRGSLNTLGSSTGEHYILSIAGGGS
ncbi:MAG: glycosyl hydrolase family 18 protein, partial [Clostridia bacterium]|nr:glycosyl hydrolase family 18 protein [Clostridia bacterium]